MSPLLSILIFLAGFFAIPTFSAEPSMRFQLIHRNDPQLLLTPKSRSELVQGLVRSDESRSRTISQVFNQRRRAMEVSGNASYFQMPIASGAYAHTGQYFVIFRVGTPAQSFLLVADTGSDLTWMNCRYRCRNCNNPPAEQNDRRKRVFKPEKSHSFRPIPCSSAMCKTSLPFSLSQCPTPTSPCAYDYRYLDGSTARGFFAHESATVTLSSGKRAKFKGIVIGCSSYFIGSSFREADGVLGLGHSPNSFAKKATEKLGGKFSYCLVDHLSPRNTSNYLIFGAGSSNKRKMRYTKLVMDRRLEPFYAVQVIGISIGGTLLKIPRYVWDVNSGGGVIVDSGTSLTVLVRPAYEAVMSALSEPLRRFPVIENKPFEFCFNSTAGYCEALVPKLALHFSESARFEPPVKSYVIDVAPQVKCLGFLRAAWPGNSVIGNILQQNYKWEFDIRRSRLGFEPSTCTS